MANHQHVHIINALLSMQQQCSLQRAAVHLKFLPGRERVLVAGILHTLGLAAVVHLCVPII